MRHIIKCELVTCDLINCDRLLFRPYNDVAPTIKLGDTVEFVSDAIEVTTHAVPNKYIDSLDQCTGCWAYHHITASWGCDRKCGVRKKIKLIVTSDVMEEV